VRLTEPHVSAEHASLHWNGACWELGDLGSLNGTWIKGRRLPKHERALLEPGAEFSLGRVSVRLVLADAAGPVAIARDLESGEMVAAVQELLVLPDEEAPVACVFRTASGRWMIETDSSPSPLSDQQVLAAGGRAWVLELPTDLRPTRDPAAGALALDAITLRLEVGAGEERVAVHVMHQGRALFLPRVHGRLLLALARRSLEEADAPPSERGWIEREALCKRLFLEPARLDMEIHRVRRRLAVLGVADAAGVVIRRPATGALRIGVPRLEVRAL
jgi:hypothetical protein